MKIPRHVAIVMDGNGRWAQQKNLPRMAGHSAGIEAVRRVIKACGERDIEILTLFAFSSENWQRPQEEIYHLMELFLTVLQDEISELHKNNVQIRFIGDTSRFKPELQERIHKAQQITQENTGLKLIIAANYGGRWDIVQAVEQILEDVQNNKIQSSEVSSEMIGQYLTTRGVPEPDLFIRTSGEQRISNFLIWQLAYTELFFTDILWPDFDANALDEALTFFAQRERRFGSINTYVA